MNYFKSTLLFFWGWHSYELYSWCLVDWAMETHWNSLPMTEKVCHFYAIKLVWLSHTFHRQITSETSTMPTVFTLLHCLTPYTFVTLIYMLQFIGFYCAMIRITPVRVFSVFALCVVQLYMCVISRNIENFPRLVCIFRENVEDKYTWWPQDKIDESCPKWCRGIVTTPSP